MYPWLSGQSPGNRQSTSNTYSSTSVFCIPVAFRWVILVGAKNESVGVCDVMTNVRICRLNFYPEFGLRAFGY